MDAETERLWQEFVQVDEAYVAAMVKLGRTDMVATLRAGLANLSWRRTALRVLKDIDQQHSLALLPELYELSKSAHQLVYAVRHCMARIPRGELLLALEPLVEAMLDDPESDYEAYRRTAEFLHDQEFKALLRRVVVAAEISPDPDIKEVAEDFGGLVL
jgi:hypothetical protein